MTYSISHWNTGSLFISYLICSIIYLNIMHIVYMYKLCMYLNTHNFVHISVIECTPEIQRNNCFFFIIFQRHNSSVNNGDVKHCEPRLWFEIVLNWFNPLNSLLTLQSILNICDMKRWWCAIFILLAPCCFIHTINVSSTIHPPFLSHICPIIQVPPQFSSPPTCYQLSPQSTFLLPVNP